MYIITRKEHTKKSIQTFGRFSDMIPFVTVWRGQRTPFDLEVDDAGIRKSLMLMFKQEGYYQVKQGRNILFKGHVYFTDIFG